MLSVSNIAREVERKRPQTPPRPGTPPPIPAAPAGVTPRRLSSERYRSVLHTILEPGVMEDSVHQIEIINEDGDVRSYQPIARVVEAIKARLDKDLGNVE